MNNIYDILEICLQELENGADLEAVLARYPDHANELRPILNAAVVARTMAVPAPSPDAVRRGRAKLLQHASEMREVKAAPRKRMIPIFQRLAISLALATIFLASGTGLVGASSSALPGENLYPVKRTWEDMRLFFTFNPEYRETLEQTFEDERLQEVNDLLVEGRNQTVHYVGVYTEVNGVSYVSGIHIVILDTSILPIEPLLNGLAVTVTGHTNADGFVDVESITLLPTGSVVPTGEPVEVEENYNDSGDNNASKSSNDNTNNNDNENSNVNNNENSNANDNNDINSNDNSNVNENSNSNDNETNANDSNSNINDNNNNDNSNDNNNDNSHDSNDNKSNDSKDGGGDD
jgi:hypothetical protein